MSNPVNPLSIDVVANSFYITYILLITTGTITFIEALRTASPMIRHIMNLETCISIIAAFFYGKFIEMRTKSNDYQSADINTLRYTDWAITTPLMLLSLGIAITYNNKTQFAFSSYLIMVVLNFSMLLAGYLGETGRLDRTKSSIAGFTLFAALVCYAWFSLMSGYPTHTSNTVIFIIFFAIWTLYGVAANFEPIGKTVSYNILDVSAKCFMGLGFWAYFTRLFK